MRFLHTNQASAGIYFVLGAGVLLSASVAAIDLVRFIEVKERTGRTARVIADYAAREAEVDCHEVLALARFAHTETLGEHSYGLLVVTLATGDSNDPAGFVEDWTWDPPRELGQAGSANRLATCRGHLAANRNDVFTALAMADGESAVMVQLCLSPDSGHFVLPDPLLAVAGDEIYHYHVVPIRADRLVHKCT